MIEQKVLLEFVSAGITASSPDNNQPFKFKLLENGMELRLNDACLGMFFDANEYASLLGSGGAIECIRLKAAQHGLQTSVTRHEKHDPEHRIATLVFHPAVVDHDPLVETIFSRCSYRGFFNADKISSQIKDAIEEKALHTVPDARILWFDGQKRKELIHIIAATDRLRYVHKTLYKDFHSKLRFGAEIERSRDGLAATTLGIETILIKILPYLKSWALTKVLTLLGIHYIMAWRGATVPLHNAAEICALVVPREMDSLEKGRALHRLWLSINAQKGLHCQVFGSLPLFVYRMQECNGDGFTAEQKGFLRRYISALDALMELDSSKESAIIFFRLGYPRQNIVRSLRRPVESFLVDKV